jgi:hypothetical protein
LSIRAIRDEKLSGSEEPRPQAGASSKEKAPGEETYNWEIVTC